MGKRTLGDRARQALGMQPPKYDNSTSAAGGRIMDKARQERNTSRFLKGAGHVADVVAVGAMVTPGGQGAGAAMLLTGVASKVRGHRSSKRAEGLRAQSRSVDALVNKAKTGNTLGVKFSPGDAKAFAEASTRYHTSQTSMGVTGGNGVVEGGRGWANPATQAAAQRARKARGG